MVLGQKLWYPLWDETKIQSTVDSILQVLQPQAAGSGSTGARALAAAKPSPPSKPSASSKVAKMTVADAEQWLGGLGAEWEGITKACFAAQKVDGPALLFLHRMYLQNMAAAAEYVDRKFDGMVCIGEMCAFFEALCALCH